MSKKFLLRINEKLWDELVRWAEEDLRSVNGQIEFLLRQAVQKRRRAVFLSDDPSSEQKEGTALEEESARENGPPTKSGDENLSGAR